MKAIAWLALHPLLLPTVAIVFAVGSLVYVVLATRRLNGPGEYSMPQPSSEPLHVTVQRLETQVRLLRKELDQLKTDLTSRDKGIVLAQDFPRLLRAELGRSQVTSNLQERGPSRRGQAATGRNTSPDLPPTPPQLVEMNQELAPATADPVPIRAAKEAVVFYAPIPEADGSFKISELKREQDWDSLYSLELEGADAAIVDLCRNRDQFEAAIQAPQKYLEPVCKYSKSPGAGASSIRVLQPGAAKLIDQRWRIQRKLEIEFI